MEKVNKKLEFLTDKFGNLYYDKEAYKDAVNYELGTNDGIEIGKIEGAKNNSIEIAKKMLNDNLDIKTITKYTNLSSEEIKEIQDNA